MKPSGFRFDSEVPGFVVVEGWCPNSADIRVVLCSIPRATIFSASEFPQGAWQWNGKND
jgi:hypothetical protein